MKGRILSPFALFLLAACARQGTLGGGSADTTPPEFLKAEPANQSVHFKGHRFRLYFDEYIKLKDIRQNLVVSPPLKQQPKLLPLKSAKKYVEVRILDSLQPNTTYSFNFGESIVDNNEGNAYGNLIYVFSTGNHLDSIRLAGVITDALNRDMDTDSCNCTLAMLYRLDSTSIDSTLYGRLPDYMAFADSTGAFQIPFIKPGDYKLYAMMDSARDFMFQPKTDKIAFVDTVLHLNQVDSTVYALRLFTEIPNFRALPPDQPQKGLIEFKFEGKSRSKKVVLDQPQPNVETLSIPAEDLDVIHYWHRFAAGDTLRFYVYNRDVVVDTLSVKILPFHTESNPVEKSEGEKENPYPLKLEPEALSNPDADYVLRIDRPLVEIDTTRILVLQDTTPIAFSAKIDTTRERVLVSFDKKPDTHYRFQALPETFTDFFGGKNDTLDFSLSTKKESDYGVIRLQLSRAIGKPFFLDLLDEKAEIKESRYVADPAATAFYFKYVEPGNYTFRIRVDKNENKWWDTGNVREHTQPEPVYFYPETFELRGFWDLTKNWDPKD